MLVTARYQRDHLGGSLLMSDKYTPTTVAELGRHLGYPPCCIRAFISLEHLGKDYEGMRAKPLFGTGFIACKSCAESFTAKELTSMINANRTHHARFPSYIGELQ